MRKMKKSMFWLFIVVFIAMSTVVFYCDDDDTLEPPPNIATGMSTGTNAGTSTGTDTGTATGTNTGSPTGTDTGSPTGTDTGSPTGTDTGTATGVITGTISGITWVTITGGTWEMGDRWDDSGFAFDKPVHTVQITGFKMTETEVTVAQYCEYLNAVEQNDNGRYVNDTSGSMSSDKYCGITRSGSSGSYTYSVVSGRDNFPVAYVTWTNSCDFCQYISGTLPSEAQWEYAAGGSNHYKWSLADTFTSTDYCYNTGASWGSCNTDYTNLNDYGLKDMSGNECEWCLDWYSNDGDTMGIPGDVSFYQYCLDITSTGGTVQDPINMYNSSPRRVIRSGSWSYPFNGVLRSAWRGSYDPDDRKRDTGFRCCR